MATGDTLLIFDALANRPPASAYAALDLRSEFAVLDFDASTNEQAQFHAPLPTHYKGGGLDVMLTWTSTSATSGDAKLRVELTRIAGGTNLDSLPSPHASADVTASCPAVCGDLVVTEVGPLAVSGLTAGEILLVQITRLATDGGDTMTGDLELVVVEVRET